MQTPPTLQQLASLLLFAAGGVGCGDKDPGSVSDSGLYNPDGSDGTDGTDGSDGSDGTGGTLPEHYEDCDPDVEDLTREGIESGWVEAARLCDDLDAWSGECPPKAEFPATSVMYRQFELDDSGGLGWDAWATCGPDAARPEECCYTVQVSMWAEGRPFRVDGRARVAAVGAGGGWCADMDGLPAAPPPVVRAWEERALAEHASVASFARFALQLLQLGAPADLVAAAATAQADEIRHARACFGVARALSRGAATGPGALDVSGSLDGQLTPEAVLVDLLGEGCIGETLAAAEAAEEARLTRSVALQTVLSTISRDEARHAALAWRAARWLLVQHPHLRPLAAEVLAAPLPPAADRVPDAPAPLLHAFGLLTGEERDELAARVRASVLAPAARALLHPTAHAPEPAAPRA